MSSSQRNTDRTHQSDRRWARYPVIDAPVVVSAGQTTFHASAVDESIGGIGIQTRDSVAVGVGQFVEINYRDSVSRGQITSVVPDPLGGRRISIRWEEGDMVDQIDASAQAAFLHYGEVSVVCRTAARDACPTTSITLWDGMQFDVTPQQVAYCTREARRIELRAMGTRRVQIARMYGIEPADLSEDLSERILDFEFGVA